MRSFVPLIFAAAAAVEALSILRTKPGDPVDVKLNIIANNHVRASITNRGESDLKLLKAGSLLSRAAVERVSVRSNGAHVKFDGIHQRVSTAHLTENAFQTLCAGETVHITFDPAEAHDLASGGSYDFLARGAFLYADADSLKIRGSIPYTSNKARATVDGAQAAAVRARWHTKRTDLQRDCRGSTLATTETALANCASLASAAADAASNGTKLREYFGSDSSSVRSKVSSVMTKVAAECANSSSGVSRTYCTDAFDGCESGVLAYTQPSQEVIVNCKLYYDDLEPLTEECHGQDQATTTLHETTHLSDVAGTEDYAYGYEGTQELSTSQNEDNADTYAMYANAIYVGC